MSTISYLYLLADFRIFSLKVGVFSYFTFHYIEVEKMTVSSAQYEGKERMAYDDLDEYGP